MSLTVVETAKPIAMASSAAVIICIAEPGIFRVPDLLIPIALDQRSLFGGRELVGFLT
jgi:hypothetical protein